MMTRTFFTSSAPLALAVAGGFPIAAYAQDTVTAEPVIVLPEAAPAPAPAPSPSIVLPEVTTAPAAEPATTTAEPEPAPVARASAAPRAATRSPRAVEPTVAPLPNRLTPATEPAASIAAPVTAATAPAPAPARAPIAAASSDETGEVALAALLGALGLAGVGAVAYAASRRRRSRAELGETAVYEPATEPAFGRTAPVDAQPVAAPTASAPTVSYGTRSNGDPVPLPSKLPESFEERDALLKALVAAPPDKANPFTSPRARARRAKLILQSLGRDFTTRKPRIDLSEYTNRWPALRGWHPATA